MDIDSQAVEVTELSLLLKVLEGENQDSLTRQLKIWRERALPDLGNNIKCGNSLIGPDFYQNQQMNLLDSEDRYRMNVFDWNAEFPEIMKAGGFEAVIGNPPYVRIQALKEWAPVEVEYYKAAYKSASKGNYDIYVVFVERGQSLLNKNGKLGFILPHKFFNAEYGEPLRGLLGKGRHVHEIVHFGEQQVFAGATTYTCLLFLNKAGSNQCRFVSIEDLSAWRNDGQALEAAIPADRITDSEWNFSAGKAASLFEKLSKIPTKLGDVAHIFVGTQTSADDVFVLNECQHTEKYVIGKSATLEKQVKIEAGCVLPFLYGKQIRKYEVLASDVYLICPYEISEHECRLLTLSELRRNFPLAMTYLEKNRPLLASREKGRFKGDNWYAFGYPKSMTLFQKPKIIVPDYNDEPSFTIDTVGYFFKTGYGILLNDISFSQSYVLGLLNSKLLFRYLVSIGTALRGGYVRFWTKYIEQLPIQPVNFSDPLEKERHDKMISLVERMLVLHKQLASSKNPQDKTRLQREIEATDHQIDQLVYKLYGLTDEEIKIVEMAQ